jgi:hypothetical protein
MNEMDRTEDDYLDAEDERLDRQIYVRRLREQNSIELERDRARLRERVLNTPFYAPDPVQQWKEDADRRTAAVERETRRRHRKEDRELALEQDVAELQQLLADALALVDQLLAERDDEVEGKRSPRPRRTPKPESEIITLPAGFIGPRHHPEMKNVRVTQPLVTKRRR